MRYRWILFDADGTLFDFEKAEISALKNTLVQAGHRVESDYVEIYRRINKQIWQDLEHGRISPEALKTGRFELFFEATGVDSDPETFSKQYLENLAEGVDLIEGAEETVRALYGKVGLVVITNGLKDVQRLRLAKSTIGEYFSDMVISEEIGAAKPDRLIFDTVFARMGDPEKSDVLIVGDSLTSDIKGGSDYGIDTCWFNPSRRPRDLDVEISYEIERLDEIVTLVGAGNV